MQEMMVYLKTTETCQLNCEHCFTSGTNGKKGWFDVEATVDFFHRLHSMYPNIVGNISFHGGEPLIAPTEMLFDTWNRTKDLWGGVWWSVQTNLTFPLTSEKKRVLTEICGKSWGTSWDSGIRWTDTKMEELWERNVKELADDGHDITVMVSVSQTVIDMEPIDIINKMISLGVKHVNFERITSDGNAVGAEGLIPSNYDQDKWFLKMWEQSKEHQTYDKIDNMFFDSVLTEVIHNTHAGCRCRQCEQKVLTLNANGSVAGCPNDHTNTFGTIYDDIFDLLNSEGRMCNIIAENTKNAACYTCPVYDTCNGDCHQLAWEGDVCPAPKSLMLELNENKDIPLFKQFLNGFVGQE